MQLQVLDGQVAMITGAGWGIGQAMAIAYAAAGAAYNSAGFTGAHTAWHTVTLTYTAPAAFLAERQVTSAHMARCGPRSRRKNTQPCDTP
jgi:NADP-dependent 3-hydroxy acid dehydrogenase YdfG